MEKEFLSLSLKLALASLSCIAVAAYNASAKQESDPQITQIETVNDLELPIDNSTTQKWQRWNTKIEQSNSNLSWQSSQSIPVEPSPVRELEVENPVSTSENDILGYQIKQGNYMTLTPTGQTNALGNPLYALSLFANGNLQGTHYTVAGRANTQNRNRHRSGTEAPLPDGRYKVSRVPVRGTIPEAGELFLPIQPLFRTGRSALGIHYDPSFGKFNGEDGTSGCIALTNKGELHQVLQYVRTYQPRYLEVNIQ